MNSKYRVVLTLFHTGVGATQRSYLYTCKHIIGGLKELVLNLEFDKEYFSYAYRHSETTLQFIKDDMREILNCSTGNNVVDSGGNRIQDHSYIASDKINIKIIDNHTNIVFLESFLDLNRQKITPFYLEIPLIENVDIKEKIENEISYSLEEIKNSVIEIDTTNYAGNDVIEEASLLGVGMIDDSWGGASNMDSSTVYQVGEKWYFKPRQYLAVEGQSDVGIYASGEMWGRYAGKGVIEVLRGIHVTTTNVGGFTIKDMNKSIVLDLKISFYLKRKRFVKVMGTVSAYRQYILNLYLSTYDEYSNNTTTVLVKAISVRLEGEYEIYEINDFPYRKVLNFNSSAPLPYNIRGYFTIRFPQDIEKPTQVDTSLGDEAYKYDFYVVENTVTTKGYSFRCDAIIDAACNSKKDAKNKLFGIRLLDYLSFIANKVGVNVSYPTLIDYGLNNILYSSENLLNFSERQISDDKYLEKIENCSLKNILDWLNTQFCLSIYIDKNNKLTLTTRDYFVNLALGGKGMIDVNRVIEIMPQKFIKRIYAGSVRHEVQFASNKESTNTECTWELETELDGAELNILCPICTDPQFIDWMLMAKTITGDKKCLIETITTGNTVSLNVVKPTKITPNKTGETISNPFPNFTNFTTRNFTNVFLSPLAQFERWRRYITTPPNNLQYKMIKCDTNFINVIPRFLMLIQFPYMKIYKYNGLNVYFNNSNTIVGGFPNSTTNVRVGVRNYDQNGHLLPLKFKVETPIYSQFLQARRKAIARFTYNGKTIIGYPNVVKTFFGEQVQEIEIEAIETSTITNINDLIE
ncbi:MAG: hypothetical protein ACOXZZ_00015 [Sphaerochaetaceae bacterium]